MTRQLLAIATVTVSLASWLACSWSEPSCHHGIAPYDGATAVPLNIQPTIALSWGKTRYPAVQQGITFLDSTSGEDVPFSIVSDGDNTVRIVPDQPLEPNHTYTLEGVDPDALDWTGLEPNYTQRYTRPSSVSFETGGEPWVVLARQLPDRHGFVMLLSEPADGTMSSAVQVEDAGVEEVIVYADGRVEVFTDAPATAFHIDPVTLVSGAMLAWSRDGIDPPSYEQTTSILSLSQGEFACLSY